VTKKPGIKTAMLLEGSISLALKGVASRHSILPLAFSLVSDWKANELRAIPMPVREVIYIIILK
jgi:hypothetical protein